MAEHWGTITRLNKRAGLMFIRVDSGVIYPATFDKIRGYRGESARELGLIVGARVMFRTSDDDLLTEVCWGTQK